MKTSLSRAVATLSTLTMSALVLSAFGLSLAQAPVAFAEVSPSISPAAVTTNAASNISSIDATLNGTNGPADASGHSFWVSLTPGIDTSSPTIPAGVYSTPDFGAIGAGGAFSASLSSVTTTGVPSNLPAITANTPYYYVAWANVDGVWTPGRTDIGAPSVWGPRESWTEETGFAPTEEPAAPIPPTFVPTPLWDASTVWAAAS